MAHSETIETHEKEIVEFSEKETEIINEMHRLDLDLNNTKKNVAILKAEIQVAMFHSLRLLILPRRVFICRMSKVRLLIVLRFQM